MYSDFIKNRKAVQKALFESKFWEVFDNLQEPFTIIENGSKAILKKIVINNVPITSDIERSFIINLEQQTTLFATTHKTVEKALLLIGNPFVEIFMFELKSDLSHYEADEEADFSGIKKKFRDTKSRILTMLPTFVFGKEFEGISIRFKGVVFYNDDSVLIGKASEKLKNSSFYKAFLAQKGEIDVDEDISGRERLEIFFFKNPSLISSKDSFSIDFSELFMEDWEYECAKNSDMGLPQIKG